MRLSQAGSQMLDRWLDGTTVPQTDAAAALLHQLTQASMVHPVVAGGGPLPSIAFVVPVYNDAAGLNELLVRLRADFATARIVVVDDCSDDGSRISRIVAHHGADLIRHETNRGPAAARNTGWRKILDTPIVDTPGVSTIRPEVMVFVDADVVPQAGAIAHMLAHFEDRLVGAAAPRVQAMSGLGTIAAYEAMSSPLDLGPLPALVRPGNRVSYVPSATLAIRSDLLIEHNGFDEALRFGEDVDLIWRLCAADNDVRYEPAAIVQHRNRGTVAKLVRQRFSYGSSAAGLATRHGDTVTPLRMPATILAGWVAAVSGRGLGLIAACVAGGASMLKLKASLDGKVDDPPRQAARLFARAHVGVAGALVNAANRNYLPLMLLTRRTRRLALAGAVMGPLLKWMRVRPRHDPLTHVVFNAVEDGAYCAGVWSGAWRERSLAALVPDVQLPTLKGYRKLDD